MPQPNISFARYFADLPDPRVDRTKLHWLDDILAIALCAVICGLTASRRSSGSGRPGRAGSGRSWCRTSFRRGRPPAARGRCLGFRCVSVLRDAG